MPPEADFVWPSHVRLARCLMDIRDKTESVPFLRALEKLDHGKQDEMMSERLGFFVKKQAAGIDEDNNGILHRG